MEVKYFLEWYSQNACLGLPIIFAIFGLVFLVFEFVIQLIRSITGNYPPDKPEE